MKQFIITLALCVIFLTAGFAAGFFFNEFTTPVGEKRATSSTTSTSSGATQTQSSTTSSVSNSTTGDDKPPYIDNPIYQIIKSEMTWNGIEELNTTDPLSTARTFPAFKFSATKSDLTNTDTKYNNLMLKLQTAGWQELHQPLNSTQGIFSVGKLDGYYVNVSKLTGVQIDGTMDISKAGYYVIFSRAKVY